MTSELTVYDEIRILEKYLKKYGTKFPKAHYSDLEHYFGVGENEITFEYFFLEMLERDIPLDTGEKAEALKLGLHLKMDENEWNDDNFWEKFENYLLQQPD